MTLESPEVGSQLQVSAANDESGKVKITNESEALEKAGDLHPSGKPQDTEKQGDAVTTTTEPMRLDTDLVSINFHVDSTFLPLLTLLIR